MARSTTPAYRVEYITVGGNVTPYCWRSNAVGRIPADGRANETNLRRHVDGFVASLQPGKANDHVLAAYPDFRVVGAKLVRNDGSNAVVATYTVGA